MEDQTLKAHLEYSSKPVCLQSETLSQNKELNNAVGGSYSSGGALLVCTRS